MFGVRPLLRTATPQLFGAKWYDLQRLLSSRPASTWTQDTEELSGKDNRRLSGRIHVLGVGNVGTFVAHSLKSRPSPPPITLMLHNSLMFSNWLSRKKCLAINMNGLDDIKTDFDVNVFHNAKWRSVDSSPDADKSMDKLDTKLQSMMEDNEEIECLIVTVKAPMTPMALEGVRHRLTPDSTVLFLQNGMGVIDEVNETVFPDPSQRPHYMVGITSHGLAQREDTFHVSHNGVGTTIIGPVLPQHSGSKDTEPDWAPSTKYLLRTLTLTPPLVAVAEPPTSLLMHQLEKLAMNSIINPLTVLMDCHNGELLYNFSVTRLMRLLLYEISEVICSLPELQGIPGIESRFSPERLRGMATQLMHKTAKNTSSMLQDVRGRKATEIEYLNGYIVRRGEELGIKCVVNYTIKHLVLAKQIESRQKEWNAIPVDVRSDLERGEP